LTVISSFIYTLLIGGSFIFLFIYLYDFLFGEKSDKQIRKIHKHLRKENINKVELIEHQPKKFSIYQVKTDKETKKVKVKPGYKVINIVPKKKPIQ
jgi:hypothetical protein